MTIAQVKDYLAKLTSHITFEYNGQSCGIDPLSKNEFNIWHGSDEMTVNSIDKVMNANFFDGKSLEEIWDEITELEY